MGCQITRLIITTPMQGTLTNDEHLAQMLDQRWLPLNIIHHSSLPPGQREVWLFRPTEETQ